MSDHYPCVTDLAADTVRGHDYDVVVRCRGRDRGVVVAAPHGGGIETPTSELAAAVAGGDHALYAFEGLRPEGNGALHVTSARFDEPAALRLVTAAETAVTIHGCGGRRPRVYVGGLNTALATRVGSCLSEAGFPVDDPPRGLEGRTPANLTNRARHAGVQLELSSALRAELVTGDTEAGAIRSRLAGRSLAFVAAVRAALRSWRAETGVARAQPSGSNWRARELMQ